jgi:diguanylate cyclase (GGDEF)-like protein
LDNDYALEICKGAEYAARELDVNLIVFPGMFLSAFFNDPENARYDYQYNSIFYYANKENLDALIVSVASIASFLSEKDIESFLSRFEGIPILTLESKVPGYPCLQTDSSRGLMDAIEHLITEHNRKHICFVSGRSDNSDSEGRLSIYKNILRKHNLTQNDDMIAYGDFSEYCRPIVGQLLDKNPDVDAIIFANDQMAIGGYAELKSRGIRIGTDISVIGFDDSPVAITMDPPLTTINVNASDLGYQSVHAACNLCSQQQVKSVTLESKFIRRLSCGCDLSELPAPGIHSLNQDTSIDEMLEVLDNMLLGDIKDSFYAPIVYDKFNDIFRDILEVAMDPNQLRFPKEKIIDKLNIMLHSPMITYFSVAKINFIFRKFSFLYSNNSKQYDKRAEYNRLNSHITSTISQFLATKLYTEMRENKMSIWSSVYITRDTLTYGEDTEKTYSLIINKLKELNFDSSYLYLYDESIVKNEDGSWTIPQFIYLQAYYNANNSEVLFGESRRIPAIELFDNEYTYYGERFTDVILPIFTKEMHHGLLICSTDVLNFQYIYSTGLQLGASLKYMSLLKQQTATYEQLMMSLNEIHVKNELLNHLSTSDELTGVNNRRGFMDKVEYLINAPANKGRKAMLLFADMDSLKVVNDKFGHKDGDFALKNIAAILSSSFRPGDIVGRIGGDEFIAFAFIDEPDFVNYVQERINILSDELNENCGKPYFIEMSVGVSEFTCTGNMKMEDLISQADTALYSNKRYKRMSVIK